MVVRLKAQAWNKSSNNATTNYYTNKYKKGLAPLYIAVKHGYAKAVKCSTKNRVGAKVQDKDTFFTSLRKVSAHNILGVVKHLIKSGIGVEITDQDGFTPLHVVAARNSVKAIKYLLENGADLEARDKNGCTPLHSAAMSGCVKGVKCLAESGANLEAQDKDGLDPLFFARCANNDKIIKLLEEKIKSKKDLSKDISEKIKSQHSQTSTVSLEKVEKIEKAEKVEKKPLVSKITYISLVATSIIGSILSIASGSFCLSIIATSVTSALIASGIMYRILKPTTELKEVGIHGSDLWLHEYLI